MSEKHKHAEILYAIADGKPVQFKSSSEQTFWKNWTSDFKSPLSYDVENWVWRLKPDTVFVNGVELKRPVLIDGGFSVPSNAVVITMFSRGKASITEVVLVTEDEKEKETLYNALVTPFK